MMNIFFRSFFLLIAGFSMTASSTKLEQHYGHNSTYFNPVLPGWHSDPSCTVVGDTFFCVTSTFIAFPGLPIYASKDLINWKLISHAWNRESQLPGVSWGTKGQQQGMYAATIRHHQGVFHVICEYLGAPEGNVGVVFKTTDPFDNEAWSDPVRFSSPNIDPDLFWDDDGKAYCATAGILLQELDLVTGEMSQPPLSIWNGTGGVYPEGPHLYKKDGWYYLMIAEGGTELGHTVTIARSRDIKGPYHAYEQNPILTNRNTTEYFQTVGHADLFQDQRGNWWGMCLSSRSGPEWKIYPMGRETVLFPVTWEEGEWPVLQPIRGKMSGWPLPPETRDIPGHGPFNSDPDAYDFSPGVELPSNLMYWRVPREGTFKTSRKGLHVLPSPANLTGDPTANDTALSRQRGLSFVGRVQAHTLFDFTVDLSFSPQQVGQEAGVTVFLTQFNHIDLSIVKLNTNSSSHLSANNNNNSQLFFRFRAIGSTTPPPPVVVPVPEAWIHHPVRLRIQATDDKHYTMSAMSLATAAAGVGRRASNEEMEIGQASAELVSGGEGPFTGSLVGVFATCNGSGTGHECPDEGEAVFQRWRYEGKAQYIAQDVKIPAQRASA